MSQAKNHPKHKSNLHPRNKHRTRYDFDSLVSTCPPLGAFVATNKYGDKSINFANPHAVRTLNKALLQHHYGIEEWVIPANYLCPPIPGRADYVHYVADLLAEDHQMRIPTGSAIKCLDIGVGANCIYPIIGQREYGWSFVGSDIDAVAIDSAMKIVQSNPGLSDHIELRQQTKQNQFFKDVIRKDEKFDISICNPPFHSSQAKAEAASRRKTNNLNKTNSSKVSRNFGGQHGELWCEGGEKQFISNMIEESVDYGASVRWFTSLVSRKSHLNHFYQLLQSVRATDVVTLSMGQGHKISRILAWTFSPISL